MKLRYGYSGAHYFDRSSGLNILLDELRPAPSTWSQAPKYISIALANACDLRCSFCYASKLPRRIDADIVYSWAHELDENGCFGIGFGGGEPTLYVGFAELCRTIHDETNLAVTMTTHGHHFTEALVEQLRGSVSYVRVSMDGINETYERIRGRSFRAFNKCLDLIRATSRFGINYVVNCDTIGELDRAAEHAFASGAEELLLLPETGDSGKIRLDEPQMRWLEAWVSRNHEKTRIAMSDHGVEALNLPTLFPLRREYQSYDFLHVDASMTLKLTAFSKDGIQLSRDKSLMDGISELRSNINEGVLR